VEEASADQKRIEVFNRLWDENATHANAKNPAQMPSERRNRLTKKGRDARGKRRDGGEEEREAEMR